MSNSGSVEELAGQMGKRCIVLLVGTLGDCRLPDWRYSFASVYLCQIPQYPFVSASFLLVYKKGSGTRSLSPLTNPTFDPSNILGATFDATMTRSTRLISLKMFDKSIFDNKMPQNA
jgi:hypothetical protein